MLSVCIWSAAKGRASRFVIEVRDTRDVPEHADRARAAAARRENAEDVRPKWLSHAFPYRGAYRGVGKG